MKTVAIVGRTNVGKSTFFNRLCQRKLAIVHDKAGVTRDRKEAVGHLSDLTFLFIDTAGLEETTSLAAAMWAQTEKAIEQADIILMISDARTEINVLDIKLAKRLQKIKKPVFLIANKCEGKAQEENLNSFYQLGLGRAIPFSAEHGLGLGDLYDALAPFKEEVIPEEQGEKPISLAVVGRPNVGKSTLINKLLKEDRLLTGPEAGVTRDAITIPFQWRETKFSLIDTAGLRKRANVTDSLEKMACLDTNTAINYAAAVVLVLDANAPLERQELTIAARTIEEGRALIIALNKWDTIKDKKALLNDIAEKMRTSLQQVKGLSVVPVSAKTGFGLEELMQTVGAVYSRWNKRISTHKMNLFLKEMTEAHPTPIAKNGRRIPMKYMTQVGIRPPTFVIFSSNPDELPESYLRYLTNGIRTTFGFEGVPIRLQMRKRENPYADKSAGRRKAKPAKK